MTERDLTGSKGSVKDAERLPSKRKQAIDPLELVTGDYVVHEQHGIGQYVELLQRTVAGVTREYLIIEYAPAKRGQPGDRIFVPTDALEQVSKYVGGETPTVHRIGSGEWQRQRGEPVKRCDKSLENSFAFMPLVQVHLVLLFLLTHHGNVNWKTPSRTSKLPTNSQQLMM